MPREVSKVKLNRPGSMQALNRGPMRVMGAPRMYPEELGERAVRLVLEARASGSVSRVGSGGVAVGDPGRDAA
jgi:hypothetical protein